jgi:hypothetical protein
MSLLETQGYTMAGLGLWLGYSGSGTAKKKMGLRADIGDTGGSWKQYHSIYEGLNSRSLVDTNQTLILGVRRDSLGE